MKSYRIVYHQRSVYPEDLLLNPKEHPTIKKGERNPVDCCAIGLIPLVDNRRHSWDLSPWRRRWKRPAAMPSLASSQPGQIRPAPEPRLCQRRSIDRSNIQHHQLQRCLHASYQRSTDGGLGLGGDHFQGSVHGSIGDVAPQAVPYQHLRVYQ